MPTAFFKYKTMLFSNFLLLSSFPFLYSFGILHPPCTRASFSESCALRLLCLPLFILNLIMLVDLFSSAIAPQRREFFFRPVFKTDHSSCCVLGSLLAQVSVSKFVLLTKFHNIVSSWISLPSSEDTSTYKSPSEDGTCACDVPKYRLVKHGVPEVTICQPRCGPGYVSSSIQRYDLYATDATLTSYVLSADFTTCICAPSSYISHNTGKVSG